MKNQNSRRINHEKLKFLAITLRSSVRKFPETCFSQFRKVQETMHLILCGDFLLTRIEGAARAPDPGRTHMWTCSILDKLGRGHLAMFGCRILFCDARPD